MKLNEYIFERINELDYLIHNEIPSEDVIEKWIVDWYRSSFNEVGCDGDIPSPRNPPMWLANWRNK